MSDSSKRRVRLAIRVHQEMVASGPRGTIKLIHALRALESKHGLEVVDDLRKFFEMEVGE